MSHRAALIFSTEAINAYQRSGFTADVLNNTVEYQFDTQSELDLFLQGAELACGEEEGYELLDVAESTLVTRLAIESQGVEPIVVEHETVADRKAFEKGLDAGDGWMSIHILQGEELVAMDSAVTALHANQQGGKPLTSKYLTDQGMSL